MVLPPESSISAVKGASHTGHPALSFTRSTHTHLLQEQALQQFPRQAAQILMEKRSYEEQNGKYEERNHIYKD